MKNIATILVLCLALGSTAGAQGLSANFTAPTRSGCSPLVISFQDQSTGNPVSWLWDFGNGATSSLRNPSTTYFNAGNYTVKLTVTNANGASHTFTRNDYITIYDKPDVKFTVADNVGCYPYKARFRDQSTPAPGTTNVSWFWDFGNGTQSTEQHPVAIYHNKGDYTVTLKVTNDKGCSRVISQKQFINIIGSLLIDFTNTAPLTCRIPVDIRFTNNTTGYGTLSYAWDFGDGNTSTAINPNHTYTKPGNYKVSLAVSSTEGCRDTLFRENAVTIRDLKTSFEVPDAFCVNAETRFLNTSSPTTDTLTWKFGDGTESDSLNPLKTFTAPGTYTVTLYNVYPYCTDSAKKQITVMNPPVIDFSAPATFRCQPPFTVQFQDLSQNAVEWKWLFGDGGSSTQRNPSHTYTTYGDFDVKLVVKNSTGCSDTLTKDDFIRINRPVITLPTLPLKGCIPYTAYFSASILSEDSITSYLWNFGDGGTSTNKSPSHDYPNQGNYDIRLRITSRSGCTDSITILKGVQAGRKPIVNFSGTPRNVCAFESVQFTDQTNEADKWDWKFTDGGSATGRNPAYGFMDTGWMDVTLYATNNGCTQTHIKEKYIYVRPPVARFNFSTTCGNRLLFSFRDSSIAPTSWFWDFGDGQTSTLPNPVHQFPAFGNYTVKLTVGNASCQNTMTRTVQVINETPDFNATTRILCHPAYTEFSVVNTNLANVARVTWDFGDNSTGNSWPIGKTYTEAGRYTVRLVTTDIYGCNDTTVKNNYIHVTGPKALFSAPIQRGCVGQNFVFTDDSERDDTNAIVRWIWDFGDGTRKEYTSNSSFTHAYQKAGTFHVKLIVQDAGGCVDSILIRDFISTTRPIIDFFAYGDAAGCPGSKVDFHNGSGPSIVKTLWDFGDGQTSTDAGVFHRYADTGRYTVKLQIEDANGCIDSLVKDRYVRIYRPTAKFDISDTVSSCTPFEVKFANKSDYIISHLWDLGVGVNSLNNPIQYYNEPGTYPIKLVVTSPGGCLDSAMSSVRVYDTADLRMIYSPLGGCNPLEMQLEAYSEGPMTYTWDFGDGEIRNTATDTAMHTYRSWGAFVPKVILHDPTGACAFPLMGHDTVRVIGANIDFGWSKPLLCDSGIVAFTDSTTFNDPIVSYQWDFGDGEFSNQQNPTHRYAGPGFYSVYLRVQTQSNCIDTLKMMDIIKVVESPMISIGGDTAVCVQNALEHFGVFERQDTSAVTWSWQLPGGTSLKQNPVHRYMAPGDYTISALATNSSGCTDSATQSIRVHALPVITLPATMTLTNGFPEKIPASYSSSVREYVWTPSNTLNCSDCPEPVAAPKFNTRYTVIATDSNSCRNSAYVDVIVICKNANVFVANTFSPNGDGSNDVFYVRGKGLDRVKSLRVFNRWGEVVFEQRDFPVNNAAYGWNGTYKGRKAPADVYVYQMEVFCENSSVIQLDGNIALIQ